MHAAVYWSRNELVAPEGIEDESWWPYRDDYIGVRRSQGIYPPISQSQDDTTPLECDPPNAENNISFND